MYKTRDRATDSVSKATRKAILAKCKALFDNNPTLESFGWWQGTSPDNHFIVVCKAPDVNGLDGHVIEKSAECSSELKQLQRRISKFLQLFAHAAMTTAFGNDAAIVVCRDGTVHREEGVAEGLVLSHVMQPEVYRWKAIRQACAEIGPRILAMSQTGATYRAIADKLNAEGHMTKLSASGELSAEETPWAPSQVMDVVNAFNCISSLSA